MRKQDVVNLAQGATERQGDEDTDAVSVLKTYEVDLLTISRGLDNAGKTTIVKRIMNEDVNSVSPTLGFIIKTIDYDG
ncbi:ADP-ribosylation factor Alp41 [Friedmanniomyces endolithicus]|nr:ADP-ribosylation factor Alp41 [Friedmanniomyces endolithicus]